MVLLLFGGLLWSVGVVFVAYVVLVAAVFRGLGCSVVFRCSMGHCVLQVIFCWLWCSVGCGILLAVVFFRLWCTVSCSDLWSNFSSVLWALL